MAGMEARDETLVIVVAGERLGRDRAHLQRIAGEHCAAYRLPPAVAVTQEELLSAEVDGSRVWPAAVLLTSGRASATRGLLLLDAHRAALPRSVAWIDHGEAQRLVPLRQLDPLQHEEGSVEKADGTAARAFAAGLSATRAPLGYVKDARHRLVPAEHLDWELARFVFHAFLESTLSRSEICHLLNAQEIAGPRTARVWDSRAIASILCDVRYAGALQFGGWVRDGCHQALITVGQLEAAQDRLRQQLACVARAHCRSARGFITTETTIQ